MGTASTGTQLMNNYQSWKHSQQPHPTTIRVKLREVGTGLWHWHKGKAALQRPAHSLFLSVIIHMTIGSQRLLSSRVLPHYLQEIKNPQQQPTQQNIFPLSGLRSFHRWSRIVHVSSSTHPTPTVHQKLDRKSSTAQNHQALNSLSFGVCDKEISVHQSFASVHRWNTKHQSLSKLFNTEYENS